MLHAALGRPIPVELTPDPRIEARVKRLSVVSAVMLGLVAILASITIDAPPIVLLGLVLGWILMPLTLLVSLRWAAARYALVVPASLVSLGLLAISAAFLPDDAAGVVGWLLVTGGVLLGGAMGMWFWFRALPVPASLDDPHSPGRWSLIGVHVSLVVVGLLLVAATLI